MCIVGEDDLSTSSMENTNLVVCSCLMAFFAFKYSRLSAYWAIKCFWLPDWGEIEGCREIPSPHPFVLSQCWTSDRTTLHSTLKNVPVERETQKTWAPPGPAGANSTPLVFPFLTKTLCTVVECYNNADFSCSDHAVGRSSCTSCCCPGGFLEEDPRFYGASSEKMTRWKHASKNSDVWMLHMEFYMHNVTNRSKGTLRACDAAHDWF